MKYIFTILLIYITLACDTQENKTKFVSDDDIKDSILAHKAIDLLQYTPNEDLQYGLDKNLVLLGKYLYFKEIEVSGDKVSCNSCHNLNFKPSFTRNQNFHQLDSKKDVIANSLLDVSYHKYFGMDAKSDTLSDFLAKSLIHYDNAYKESILNDELAKKLYINAYDDINNYDIKNLSASFEAYLQSLKSHSRFDDFLDGYYAKFTKEEKSGLNTFLDKSCYSCHSGSNFGGSSIASNSIKPNAEKIKVPSLRNIAFSAPYLYDGTINSLETLVYEKLKAHSINDVSDSDINDLVVFLKTLSDENLEKNGYFYNENTYLDDAKMLTKMLTPAQPVPIKIR